MMVRWASGHPTNLDAAYLVERDCGPLAGAGGWQRLSATFSVALRSLGAKESEEAQWDVVTSCPHHVVMNAGHLMEILHQPEAAQELLEGAIVIIGADVRGINDTHISPIHGRLASTLWHAMALDNLMETGSLYLKRKPHLWDKLGEAVAECLVMIPFVFLAGVPASYLERKSREQVDAAAGASAGTGSLVAQALLLLISLGILFAFGLAAATGSLSPVLGLVVSLSLVLGMLLPALLGHEPVMRALRRLYRGYPRAFALVQMAIGSFGAFASFAWMALIGFGVELLLMRSGWAPTLWLSLMVLSMAGVFLPPIREPLKRIFNPERGSR